MTLGAIEKYLLFREVITLNYINFYLEDVISAFTRKV